MPLCMTNYSEVMCAVHVKYCNHLLAVDMAGVACRGLWYACCWKNAKKLCLLGGGQGYGAIDTQYACMSNSGDRLR